MKHNLLDFVTSNSTWTVYARRIAFVWGLASPVRRCFQPGYTRPHKWCTDPRRRTGCTWNPCPQHSSASHSETWSTGCRWSTGFQMPTHRRHQQETWVADTRRSSHLRCMIRTADSRTKSRECYSIVSHIDSCSSQRLGHTDLQHPGGTSCRTDCTRPRKQHTHRHRCRRYSGHPCRLSSKSLLLTPPA